MGRDIWARYFSMTNDGTTAAEASRELITSTVRPSQYTSSSLGYQTAVLEQYRIYVEMADRVSARRATANTFFLTLNSLVVTLISVFWNRRPAAPQVALLPPLFLLLMLCLTWFWILRSYRQLNAAKYVVIGALEERLPTSPYYRAEWGVLRHGQDPARYWPLSHVEQWIPLIFATAYVLGALIALLTR